MTLDDESWREEVASGPKKKKRPSGGPLRIVTDERDTRAEIILTPDVHLTTERMAEAVVDDPELYQRAGSLAHVIRANESTSEQVIGTPITRTMPLSMLIDRVSKHAKCLKYSSKNDKYLHVPPPSTSVRAVLERGSWARVRELRGIIEAPSMRPDGTVIQVAGYDAVTGFLYEPNATFPTIAEKPSHSDCVLAFARLLEPFADFPYVNEAHRAATIAGALTLLARPAIVGSVPCWLFDASAARSGKSLQVDVISLIATGRVASRMTYPEQDEELEKVLAGYALRGARIVNFDNVARKFGGAALDKVITAVDKVDLRMLGATDLVTLDWRAVVFASGNNVGCRGDMLARVLSPRLETPLANPETRSDFRYADLRGWVADNRTELVAAALTILRGYIAAGKPDQGCERWGGFEAWSRLVPHALKWVGAADPMGARRGLDGDEDVDRVCAGAMVDGWHRLCVGHGDGLTVKGAIALLYPGRSHHDPHEPDGHDALREAVEQLTDAKPGFPPSTRKMGEALRKLKARPVGGKKLVSKTHDGGVARWRVIPI